MNVGLAHHSKTNLTSLDETKDLKPWEFDVVTEGSFGAILETFRHRVGSNFFCQQVLSFTSRAPLTNGPHH